MEADKNGVKLWMVEIQISGLTLTGKFVVKRHWFSIFMAFTP